MKRNVIERKNLLDVKTLEQLQIEINKKLARHKRFIKYVVENGQMRYIDDNKAEEDLKNSLKTLNECIEKMRKK